MKPQGDFQGHFQFRRDEVLAGEVKGFLKLYEPARLSALQLRRLFGSISIEIEGAAGCGDLATIPEGRKLIQHLHSVWPWAGFFLDHRRPFGSARALGTLPLLAYGLCLVDMELVAWDRIGKCEVSLDERQLRKFRDQCFGAVVDLGQRAEIPSEVVLGRQEIIANHLNLLLSSV